MAAPRFRLNQGQLDVWSVRERLALACSVLRSGDQNWVSVSRAIKPYGEVNRPPEWFSQKNCALQYADLLDKAETPKRKRGERGEIETPGIQINRKLSIERMEELKAKVTEQQQRYKKLKKDIESVKSGQLDDRLTEILAQMQQEKEAAEKAKEAARKLSDDGEGNSGKPRKGTVASRIQEQENASMEIEDSNHGSIADATDATSLLQMPDEALKTQTPVLTLKTDLPLPAGVEKQKSSSASSDLLSSLLKSARYKVEDLQQLKTEAEYKQDQAQLAAAKAESQPPTTSVTMDTTVEQEPVTAATSIAETVTTPSSVAPTLTKLLVKAGKTEEQTVQPTNVEEEVATPDVQAEAEVDVTKNEEDEREEEKDDITEDEDTRDSTIDVGPTLPVKLEDNPEDSHESCDVQNSTYISVDDEISIKEEPLSPASSVSSKLSEGDNTIRNPRRNRRGRQSKGRKPSKKLKKSQLDEEKKDQQIVSRLSDGETTEDEVGESDDTITTGQHNASTLATFSESIPNSPLSHCSDTEDEKQYKNWKKSIMLVWRSAANHKYANVFLHPVKEAFAPGYTSIVSRPMDLGTIKKNIETSVIKTTAEFQRDMMLMFTNAVMYNSSNHNVYSMAVEMYEDVLQHIEIGLLRGRGNHISTIKRSYTRRSNCNNQYVSTQLMVQSNDTKHLRGRRAENSDKEEETKRRRTSSEAHSEGGKAKKRKT